MGFQDEAQRWDPHIYFLPSPLLQVRQLKELWFNGWAFDEGNIFETESMNKGCPTSISCGH